MTDPRSIHSIDLMHQNVPGAIAAWAVEGPEGWLLVESGPASTGDALDEGLTRLGVTPDALAGVLLTHIHLDHAGGAWRYAQQGVPIHVHHVGRPHLVDPARLERSARRIYGDRYDSLWGPMQPCEASLVQAVSDGEQIQVAGLNFEAIETLGHARHHHAWHLLGTDVLFSGDAAAMRVPDTDWLTIPMPPPEFDHAAWQRSMDRLASGPWESFYLTHGGIARDIAGHLTQLRASMTEQIAWITASAGAPDRLHQYRDMLRSQAEAAGVPDHLFQAHVTEGLLAMNLTGVDRWASDVSTH